MQAKFREMSESRGLWHGAKVATHQDLSTLFVARVLQLYSQSSGRFAFVMPNAVLDREQFAGFRAGEYPDPADLVRVAFATPWDLRRLRPHFFPRGSCVVFGRRVSEGALRMPASFEIWTGRLPAEAGSWGAVAGALERQVKEVRTLAPEQESKYRKRFHQGATIVPRVLFVVEPITPGPLGVKSGTVIIRSVRSANEKRPWKDLDSLEGLVESEFVYRLFLGEHVLPYRTLSPARAVVPWQNRELLHSGKPFLDLFPALSKWWRRAEEVWNAHRSTDRMTLSERLDYHGGLTSQFPIQPVRVVYAKAGMHVVAARIEDRRHLVDHKLYWATPSNPEEASYLCGILNSAELTRQTRPLMSYGKDERDVDKHIWRLPIPEFDPAIALHAEIAALAAEVEKVVRALPLDEAQSFVSLRRQIRLFLEGNPAAQKIEERVAKLLK